MIVITGGAGFIGRNLANALKGMYDIVVVDNNLKRMMKMYNEGYGAITYLTVEDSYLWLQFNAPAIEYVFHLGARTDTMEMDVELLKHLNFNYSKFIWNFCYEEGVPLIYASSAAVYGDSECFGEHVKPEGLHPMNPYGQSKLNFDAWALQQEEQPESWTGLRFFNVYGPHEDHKGKMASVVYHFYNQINETGEVKLFKSHKVYCEDGEQMRDFIHVRDIVNTIFWFFMGERPSGIYNLGTGNARSYNDLAEAVFKSLGKKVKISYIDTPIEIRDNYQYFTEAKMDKLKDEGYNASFTPLEEGIDLYVKYLENENS